MSASRFVLILCWALAGCAEFNAAHLSPGMSAAQVRAKAGAPSEERTLPDGSKTWYYAFGFSGFTTYRVRFDANDRVIEDQQVLTEKNFLEHLIPNRTTREDVLRDFGRPGEVSRFANLNEVVWTYRWRDVTMEMLADLEFDAGTGALRSYSLYRDPAYVSGLSD
jgi:hypothetical protein